MSDWKEAFDYWLAAKSIKSHQPGEIPAFNAGWVARALEDVEAIKALEMQITEASLKIKKLQLEVEQSADLISAMNEAALETERRVRRVRGLLRHLYE